MMHSAYKRIVPGAKTAVLMIHGICGTPNHFRTLLPLQALVPADWSVHNILLDGHGKGVKDFAHTSMKKWKEQVWQAFQELSENHERVILVSHSMGTLFSIQLSLEFPEKIPFLFLIAVPLETLPRWFGICNILRLALDRLDHSKPLQAAMVQVCGIQTTKKLWKYVPWLPRIIELLREMSYTKKLLQNLTVPVIAYQSRRDELVARRSYKILVRSGKAEVHELQASTHFYYAPEEIALVQKAFQAACALYV